MDTNSSFAIPYRALYRSASLFFQARNFNPHHQYFCFNTWVNNWNCLGNKHLDKKWHHLDFLNQNFSAIGFGRNAGYKQEKQKRKR